MVGLHDGKHPGVWDCYRQICIIQYTYLPSGEEGQVKMVEISGDRIESPYEDSQGCPGECGASHMALKAKAEKERGSKHGPPGERVQGEKLHTGNPVGRSLQKFWYQVLAPGWAVW